MADIRRQFSLDWLGESDGEERSVRSAKAAKRGPAQPDEASVLFYGQALIKNLSRAPEREMRFYELAKQSMDDITDFSFDTCLAVVHRLAELGVMRIVDKDPGGNHLVRLGK